MNKQKPVVGQVVYRVKKGQIEKATVARVGGKYFYCVLAENSYEYQFYIDDWAETTSWNGSKLYANTQEWEDEKESESLCSKLNLYFDYGNNRENLTLKQLREIKKILEEI